MTVSSNTIRRLEAGDVAAFRALLSVFAEAFDDAESYLAKQPNDAYLATRLADESFIALAAFDDGALIGGLAAYELKKFEQQRSEIYIYDLAVLAAHRRHGVATRLIEALKPIAKACRAHVIYVQADHTDPPAIALYAKLGVREDVLHFDIPVD